MEGSSRLGPSPECSHELGCLLLAAVSGSLSFPGLRRLTRWPLGSGFGLPPPPLGRLMPWETWGPHRHERCGRIPMSERRRAFHGLLARIGVRQNHWKPACIAFSPPAYWRAEGGVGLPRDRVRCLCWHVHAMAGHSFVHPGSPTPTIQVGRVAQAAGGVLWQAVARSAA